MKQAWIVSARFDSLFILAPALLVSVLALVFQDVFSALAEMPAWLWLLLIVGVDASHVYGTLFRTYFVRDELAQRHKLLTLTPLLVWLTSCALYSVDSQWFWRVLAYLAVFHFIRQQYGFMMIYVRLERDVPGWYRSIDKAAIYAATLFPLLYWHCAGRSFDWFMQGDFILFHAPAVTTFAAGLYALVLLVYGLKELQLWRRSRIFNWPRNLWLLGTVLSWGVGIVVFDDDLIFTACNVLAHGVPYLALSWAYGRKQSLLLNQPYVFPWIDKLFNWKAVPLYLGLVFALAYFEEGLWDGLVWREHVSMFQAFAALPAVTSPQTLVWLVPLLSLPQATHYVLDAFIWRLQVADTDWKRILFYQGL